MCANKIKLFIEDALLPNYTLLVFGTNAFAKFGISGRVLKEKKMGRMRNFSLVPISLPSVAFETHSQHLSFVACYSAVFVFKEFSPVPRPYCLAALPVLVQPTLAVELPRFSRFIWIKLLSAATSQPFIKSKFFGLIGFRCEFIGFFRCSNYCAH